MNHIDAAVSVAMALEPYEEFTDNAHGRRERVMQFKLQATQAALQAALCEHYQKGDELSIRRFPDGFLVRLTRPENRK